MKLMDEGHGITVSSLKFWRENKSRIGKVLHIAASFEPLEKHPITLDNNRLILGEYTLEITGSNGKMLLSGCNCGYGGEGPNGTKQILEELGVPKNEALNLIYHKKFIKEIGGEKEE